MGWARQRPTIHCSTGSPTTISTGNVMPEENCGEHEPAEPFLHPAQFPIAQQKAGSQAGEQQGPLLPRMAIERMVDRESLTSDA